MYMNSNIFFRKGLLCFFIAFVFCVNINARDRSFIRKNIQKHGSCRNVAITKTNGDLMLYGRNGCARSEVPLSLSNAITELNNEKVYIDDIQLTENGSWLILYGDNNFRWNDIPYSLEKKIREYHNLGEVIYSVTFNDTGDWIVISKQYFTSSDDNILRWLTEGTEEYGGLWSACVTNDAVVAVFSNGYKFFGEVPYSLKKSLSKTKINAYRIKVAGNAWFYADTEGHYDYRM